MKEYEFLRVIEEVCLTLDLSRPCITQIMSFYRLFQGSETHSFKTEIVVVACIYLSSKINEELKRIRDILNMTYIVTSTYKKRNKELTEKDPDTYKNKILYVPLDYLIEEAKKDKEGEIVTENVSDWFIIDNIPNFSLEKYNKLRDEILSAEQHLLRILNYDLENKYESYYQLLFKVLKNQDLSKEICEKCFAVYNDSFFVDELKDIKEDCLVETQNEKSPPEFVIKMTEKLEKDKTCQGEFERFTSCLLDYYKEEEEPIEKKNQGEKFKGDSNFDKTATDVTE